MFSKTFFFHPAPGRKAPTDEKEKEAREALVIPRQVLPGWHYETLFFGIAFKKRP
jgi:hypothetical protein